MTGVKRTPATFSLGEREFTVRPLTLSQVEKIHGLLGPEGATLAKNPVSVGIQIILVALSRDNPEETADEMEGTANDISRAIGVILPLAFERVPSGEAQAAAKTA